MYVSTLVGFNAAITADRYTDPLDVRELKGFRFQVSGATTGTPVGVFKVQVCENFAEVERDVERGIYGTPGTEKAVWTTVTLPLGSVHGLTTGQTFAGPDDEIAWDGTNALAMWISLLDGACMVRLWWDRTSGGTTNTPTVRAGGRSR